ncbi:hypothetical protein RB594_005428 [Gaeumannomyces avenae]
MLRSALGPVCLACRISGNASAVGAASRSLPQGPRAPAPALATASRAFSTSHAYASPLRPQKRTPSRMVLSDKVAHGAERSSSRPRRTEGPFGGMNRRVANIDPDARSSGSRGPPRDSSDRKSPRRGPLGRDGRGFKALKMQQSLATVSYGARARIKSQASEFESFDQFNLLPSIKEAVYDEALKGMTGVRPTPVQRLAIPALLGQTIGRSRKHKAAADGDEEPGREEFLLAAETGSGKTLAYLVPALNALKLSEAQDPEIMAYNQRQAVERERRAKEEEKGHASGQRKSKRATEPHPTMARPRVVVLVPTAELVDQVGKVAKSLSHKIKARTRLVSANYSATVLEADVFSPAGIDVLIATPHLLSSIAATNPNVLSRVTDLIVDEADSLLDRSFSEVTESILERAMPSVRRLVMCSATIPRHLDRYLDMRYPKMRRITTPNLHAIPRRVQLGVIDVSRDPYKNNKNLACAEAIWSIGRDAARHEGPIKGLIEVNRIMVFVNEREKTHELAEYLVSKGIDAVALHRDTEEERQSEMLASFTSSHPLTITDAADDTAATAGRKKVRDSQAKPAPTPTPAKGRKLLNTKVIVATDLASRGIDTLAVRHVVLYDVPHTTIDFIHRLGRAGRMGRRGRGIVLVGKDDRKDIVAEVKESMFMGQALV